ncbi:hypothetical protein niasHT_018672 [Heterodera trifolii]|uniref:HAT C-terminal dimerisation domain-containing protein n=1 Tax=Heterodera trifolii TaxID=157864 RepID=A0ABD2LJQ4_9BILA
MDSDENSPILLNLDTSFQTPLTSQENKIRKQRKINIGEKQWSRKHLKNTSKYSNLYEELLENGNESDYLICKICKKPVYKKNWRLISEHYKVHFVGNSVEKLKADYKHKITCAALKGKPFRFFETEEFHGIVTAFGQLCVAHANIGILCESRSVTPSPNGIAQAVRDRATGIDQQNEYKGLVERIKISGAICYDFGKNKRDYFVITAHVITENFLLRPFIIHFGEWSGSAKTRKAVTDYTHNLLIKKGAASSENVTQIGRTTDEGQNVISGGEERSLHVRCLCHILATIARRTTEPYHGSRLSAAEKRQLNQFSDQLKELSKFVTTAKNIPKIDDMAGSFLLESVCTRWLTNHIMSRAFHEGIDKIKEAVARHGDDSLKADFVALAVFKDDFEAYTGIFEAFSMAVAKLEAAKSPTINLVLPVLAQLELHLQRCSDNQMEEHSLQRTLARSALSCLARKIERSVNRKIVGAAAYLDPNILRKMESISEKVPRWSLNDCKGSVRHLVTQLELWDRRCTGGGSATEIILENDVFAEFASSPPVSNLENEMRLHENMPCTKVVDVLEFWRKQTVMPNLKRLAQKILCIPASSAHAERAFSHLRRLKTDFTRNNMTEKTISSIICCGSLNHFGVFADTDQIIS